MPLIASATSVMCVKHCFLCNVRLSVQQLHSFFLLQGAQQLLAYALTIHTDDCVSMVPHLLWALTVLGGAESQHEAFDSFCCDPA